MRTSNGWHIPRKLVDGLPNPIDILHRMETKARKCGQNLWLVSYNSHQNFFRGCYLKFMLTANMASHGEWETPPMRTSNGWHIPRKLVDGLPNPIDILRRMETKARKCGRNLWLVSNIVLRIFLGRLSKFHANRQLHQSWLGGVTWCHLMRRKAIVTEIGTLNL